MRDYIYLWLSILGYSILSFILLLRDEWALKTIAAFYSDVGQFLFTARELALKYYLNTIPSLIYAAIIVLAFFFYWRLINGKWMKTQSFKNVILLSIALKLTLLVSYPILSTDVFDYILDSRIAYVYQQNPWTTASINFKSDPFINLGSWQRISSVYGPTHHFLTLIPEIIGGSDLLLSVLGFKLLMIAASIVSIILLSVILGKKDKAKKIALFTFNPLFLIETAGNAHNDIIMVFFMIAGFLMFTRHRFSLSGILIGLGTMVKLYAAAFLPLFFISLIVKRKLKDLLSLFSAFLGSILVGVWFMGTDSIKEYIKLVDWVFTLRLNSLPNLLNQIPNWVFTLPFLIFAAYVSLKIKNHKDLIYRYVILTLGYLLFVVPLYWAWYPIWYLPFLSLLPITKLSKTAITFSFSSMLHYAVLFLSHRFNYQHLFWTIAIYVVLVAPPIYVYLTNKNGKTT
jgi:hypothetical protein